ncbi:MAG: FtsX-like permease family protein, partial [Pseudomonadota bacterium]
MSVSLEPGQEELTSLMQVRVDDQFVPTYEIDLVAGRNVDSKLSADVVREGVLAANVLVNEMAARELGFGEPAAALGKIFDDRPEEREPRAYTIVGVLPDQNFQGFHNEIRPMILPQTEEYLRIGSIKVTAGTPMHKVLSDVEAAWLRVVPAYPIQTEFLNDTFGEVFSIFALSTRVLGGFALIALLLSTIGLFGLAAFMAQIKTREIGIRKVMGASVPQIVQLLIWQISRPVMWSLLLALPLAYLASDTYLNFFADRISAPSGIVLGAGVVAVLFAWSIVAVHAVRIAHANPIAALRYE